MYYKPKGLWFQVENQLITGLNAKSTFFLPFLLN
jgi:hypothetical protein